MSATHFSAKNRSSIIQKLSSTSFDLLVIGGGITGAGIALDAISRGLTVALVDMQDFAAGTSSRSTKLIHGGLRYLKQLDVKLVAEVGKERAIVHRNAPHLAKPEPMLLPIVKGGSLGMFSARIGMWIYEWLAGVKKEEWHKVLTKQEALLAEPLLRSDILLGGIKFYEYRTDDARLTIEVMKEAVSRGALALNYSKALEFIYDKETINGAKIKDVLTDELFTVKANYVVNATGPWVDEVDSLDEKKNSSKLRITKGVHIVVDGVRLPIKQSLYFDTPDKRMVFLIPREGKTYIGTTDTFYSEDIIHPTFTVADRDYLVSCVNHIFPTIQLDVKDIESSWAGLRPLIQMPGKGPSEISRKDEMFQSVSGLITIAGGKLTGYRKMAERVVDVVAKRIKLNNGKRLQPCSTAAIQLAGGKIDTTISFTDWAKKQELKGIAIGFTKEEAHRLVHRYGSDSTGVYSIAEKLKAASTDALPLFIKSQLLYVIENEMCVTPADFFIRRTGALYFDMAIVTKYIDAVTDYMKAYFNWDNNVAEKHKQDLLHIIKNTITAID